MEIINDKNPENVDFTIQTLADWAGISESSVRRRLRELINKGIISENKDKKPFKYKIDNMELFDFGDIELIPPEDLEGRIANTNY